MFRHNIPRAIRTMLEINPLGRASQHHPAGHMQTNGLPGDLFDLFVEPDYVVLQFGNVRVTIDRMETTCRMPCGP